MHQNHFKGGKRIKVRPFNYVRIILILTNFVSYRMSLQETIPYTEDEMDEEEEERATPPPPPPLPPLPSALTSK